MLEIKNKKSWKSCTINDKLEILFIFVKIKLIKIILKNIRAKLLNKIPS